MLGCLNLVGGLLTLAYWLTGLLGVIQLIVLQSWTGFWQWTLVSLGLALVRFVVVGVFGLLLARSPTSAGSQFRSRVQEAEEAEARYRRARDGRPPMPWDADQIPIFEREWAERLDRSDRDDERDEYQDRNEERIDRWETMLDELDELLVRSPRPTESLVKLEKELEMLADQQRRERIPEGVSERRNAAMTRLFEVQRDLIRDYRLTGGKNDSQISLKRWDLLEELELEDVIIERD